MLEEIKNRRSIRKYKPTPVETEKIDAVIEAGLWAASGMGRQSPIIIAITDKSVRDELSKANAAIMGAEIDPFYGAPAVLVVLVPKSASTGIYDGSLTIGNMLLEAAEQGLGACWIHRAKEEFESDIGKKLLAKVGLTGAYEGVGHVILGYADADPKPVPRNENRVFYIR